MSGEKRDGIARPIYDKDRFIALFISKPFDSEWLNKYKADIRQHYSMTDTHIIFLEYSGSLSEAERNSYIATNVNEALRAKIAKELEKTEHFPQKAKAITHHLDINSSKQPKAKTTITDITDFTARGPGFSPMKAVDYAAAVRYQQKPSPTKAAEPKDDYILVNKEEKNQEMPKPRIAVFFPKGTTVLERLLYEREIQAKFTKADLEFIGNSPERTPEADRKSHGIAKAKDCQLIIFLSNLADNSAEKVADKIEKLLNK